jgi:hypothetical protein
MPETDSTLQKLEFDLHVGHITETHKALIDNAAKVAGFQLLALGWLATSESARGYLALPRLKAVVSA